MDSQSADRTSQNANVQEGPEGWQDVDIKEQAIACKHGFSELDDDDNLPLEVYVPTPDGQVVISREFFEEQTRALSDKSMACVDRCLDVRCPCC